MEETKHLFNSYSKANTNLKSVVEEPEEELNGQGSQVEKVIELN